MSDKNQSRLLVVISGPSGVGKNTLIETLIKRNPDKFAYSISATSRKPRAGEKAGVNYFFMTREEFERKIAEGAFIEWAIYQGEYYGTLKEYIKKDKQGNYICAADNLNIRIKPNLSSKIIGTLKRNTPLKVIGKTKEFFIIDPYPFAYAWVHKKFVKPLEPIQIETPTTPEEKPQKTPSETEGAKTSPLPLDTEKDSAQGQIIHKEGKLLKRFFSKNPCGLVYYLKAPKQERIYLNWLNSRLWLRVLSRGRAGILRARGLRIRRRFWKPSRGGLGRVI